MSADSPTPTPAAPAGSGTERRIDAMLADLVERRAIGVIGPLDELLDAIVAQRARAEAAERENALLAKMRDGDEDTIGELSVGWVSDWEWADEFAAWYEQSQWFGSHRAASAFLNQKFRELTAALSAATAREAGLRALCEEALQVAEAYCPRQRDIGDCASCGALRARLASLAAPEGGTTDG